MTGWRSKLRDWDPGKDPVDAAKAQKIRRAILESASAGSPERGGWRISLALVAVAVLLTLAVAMHDRFDPATEHAPPPPAERRQIQFSTPGGTRIIWELNPEFSLSETLP